MTDLATRVLAHVTESRDACRERIQRENAELFAMREREIVAPFDGKSIYVHCEQTGRVWGKDICQRIREAGGKGIAVVASASCKPGKAIREKR